VSLIRYVRARLESLLVSDDAFVDRAFREILGRDADQGGLEFYRRVLRQGRGRTSVLLEIMRSEEFRNTLAPPAPSALPNLVVQRPERYRRTIDRSNGNSILVFDVASASDLDWLERAILDHGYYEAPGVWVLDVDFDKRVVAELLSAFAPAAALELGCASGAVLQCLDEAGVVGSEGVEISAMAIARAADGVRPRIHHGDLLSLPLEKRYDLLFGLDVFEHLNPNKLDAYIRRIAGVTTEDAYLFCNIPAFGADAVFGTVFPFYVDGWSDDAAAGRSFRSIHVDDLGYPIHGHLAWGDAGWWTRQFEQAGFTRDDDIERALHRKYGAYMEKRSPARRALFVFGKDASAARRAAILQRIATPSRLI
jgi:hypothetical protein